MKNVINKFNEIVDKIGIYNISLIVFIFMVVLTTGLYTTFSIFTTTDLPEMISGVPTYKFVLNNDISTTSVVVAANSSKGIEITVSNKESMELKYGIYYSSSDDLTNVTVYKASDTEYESNGNILAESDYVVLAKIENNSDFDITIDFGLLFGLESGGELVLDDGQYWIGDDPSLATNYIKNLYGNGTITTVNIGGDTSNPTVNLNATQGIMLDNNGEYRYYGSNPNNYVEFNGELWRIIGGLKVKSGTSNTVENLRIKIIREVSIGGYSWDSSASTVNSGYGINDWSQSDLMVELNSIYYEKTSGICYNGQNNASTTCDFSSIGLNENARNLISSVVWNLGGIAGYSGLYADDYYNRERGTIVWTPSGSTCSDGVCPRTTTWTGKVGLMYPSDYVYATDLSVCTKAGYDYEDDANCYENNWLYNAGCNEWLLSPSSDYAMYAFYVHNLAAVDDADRLYNNFDVRPTVYLIADARIYNGTGTSSDPYILE